MLALLVESRYDNHKIKYYITVLYGKYFKLLKLTSTENYMAELFLVIYS